jgi:tRNA (cmo5U34)-methyltransferase
MSVAAHLKVTPERYDAKIRRLIPFYDELLAEAASALRLAPRRVNHIVDLGMGTGALAKTCLAVMPRARIWGIDADAGMMTIVARRLGPARAQVQLVHGNFLTTELPSSDAIVASYSLHHIRSGRAKQQFYRRCHDALRPGGVLINGDCAPGSARSAADRDLEVWFTHLARTFGRAKGRKVYESWADEDTYIPLADEVRMLERARFAVEVPWRRSPFAVIVGIKSHAER